MTDHRSMGALSRNALPSLRTQVHNANFLGAAVLYRANKYSGEKRFIAPALKVARYSAEKQRDDGSWAYGEHDTQSWVFLLSDSTLL